MPEPLLQADVKIAASASLSGAAPIEGRLGAIIMPSAWTAANLTFQGCLTSGGTFVNIYDDAGTEYTVTAAASRFIILDPTKFAGVNYVKVRSGTSSAAVTQAAERTITLISYS